jgi:hypothetical protein
MMETGKMYEKRTQSISCQILAHTEIQVLLLCPTVELKKFRASPD